ncbi:reverse transcriptase domain-containing protein [Tanacetum coccineum]|uniref:Reverse transcriptase domain-containing protein n=1 Tax=Tanacetum coccineum TaxID=301880 RepID=A0ABQ4ZLA6_9ASTR
MWAADRVVAPTSDSAIAILETANEFAIKGNHLTLVKGNQFDGRTKIDPHKHIYEFLRICDMFKYRDTENEAVRLMMFPLSPTEEAKTWLDELNEGTIEIEITQEVLNAAAGGIFLYKTPNQAYQHLEEKVLLKLGWAKNQKTKSSLKKTFSFTNEGNSNSDTNKIMARMDAMTIKMDAQYKELQSRAKQPTPDLDDDDIPMSREEEAKFMQTFCKTRFYNDYRERDSNRDNWRSSRRNNYNRDNYRSNTDDKSYDLQRQFNDFIKSQQSTNTFLKETFMDLKTQLKTVAKNHQASIQNLKTKFDRLADKQSGRPSGSLPSSTQPNPRDRNSKAYQPPQSRNEHVNVVFTRSVPPKLGDPGSFLIPCNFNKTFSCNALADLSAIINLMSYSLYAKLSLETLKPTKMSIRLADRSFQYHVGIAENMLFEVVIRVKQKQVNLRVGTERIIFNIDSSIKHSYSNNDTCFSINVIDEILEEDFDSLLDEGRKILHSIEGTVLEEEIFSKFDKFIAMIFDEIYDSESDTEEPPFKKITINTDYKIKTSLEEPPTDLELKPLPDNLEYIFLEEPSFLLIQLLDDKKPVVQKQRRLNPNMQKVVKKEIVKLLDTGIIYPIADSPWVSPIHCVPKKGGIIVVTNKNDELVLTRTVTGWQVCIDYRKLNEATAKDHFPLPFMDQMLERLAGNKYFCFLKGFSGYFQIPIDPNDQEKTTFTCPFGTYAYRRMPFELCNAPAKFQRCMLAIFHDLIKESVKVFMEDFSVFGNSFDKCLNNLDKMLQRCKDAHLVLN